ncbi:MAG: hypothetical protein E7484_04610 [Ruminococcaceae bacterium]|nr:hypothetical protein [Oscillospiraceae bacterium]
MDLLFTLFSFAAVTGIAVFISLKYNMNSGLTPFVSSCFAMMFLSLFGCLGFVKLGGYLYFLLALAAVIYMALGYKNNWKALSKVVTPGFVFFVAASVFVIVLFSIKQPMYIVWDEFSFWGTSVKLIKVSGEMYTTAEIGWEWAATQKPGLVMNSYLYEFFGHYQEWRACAGMDVLLFSVAAAVASCFENKNWHKAVPFIVIAFLTPFAFSLYNTITPPSSIYMSVMADVPMGMIFGAVMCLYFGLRGEKHGVGAVCIALATLTFVKDTAFPLAMVAAVIICADIIIAEKECSFGAVKGFAGKIINCIIVFITPVITFIAWTVYLGAVLNVDATGNVGGSEQMSMFGMLIEGIKQLLGIGTTEKFVQVMGQMLSNYFNIRLTVLGSGLRVTIVILCLTAVAFLTAADKRQKIRSVLYAVLSTAGFAVYYIFIGFCFVFVFKDAEAASLASYERYVYPYYIGWFLAAVMLVAQSAAQKTQKIYGLARASVLAVTLLMVLRLSNILLVGHTFVDFDENFLKDRREQVAKVECIMEYIPDAQQKIFFIGQGDDGNRWFRYSNQMLPLQLAYSYGGGTICHADAQTPGDSLYYIKVTQDELLDYLQENNCGYIFVERSDSYLESGFGHMFSDALESCKDGKSALYKINGSKFEFIGEVK